MADEKCNGRIPAPVVPSDDECQACNGEGGGYVSVGANEWDAQACDVCRGTGRRLAPPTPSQDAEGDRRPWVLCMTYAQRRDELEPRFCNKPRDHKWHCDWTDIVEVRDRRIEAAIREPYEALVKAARDLRRYAAIPSTWRIEFFDARDRFDNALTHIEESLGGRKDG